MNRVIAIALTVAVALATAGPSIAHHSSAMYDKSREVTVTGVVSEFQWTNPHVYIEIDSLENGARVHYSVEAGPIRTMMKLGWKVRSLKAGDKVTVAMNPMRNGSRGGLIVSATLPDGRVMAYDPAP